MIVGRKFYFRAYTLSISRFRAVRPTALDAKPGESCGDHMKFLVCNSDSSSASDSLNPRLTSRFLLPSCMSRVS
jgi:hypothetical protein